VNVRRALAAACIVAGAACARTADHSGAAAFRPLAVGDTVPVVTLRTLSGDSTSVMPGKVTLVNLWATWCESCREEMDDLAAIDRDFRGRGLSVLAVSEDDGDAARVQRFLSSNNLDLPVAMDIDGAAKTAYQAVALPESYLVGPDGRLLWRHQGGLHGDVADARAAVERALTPR
jgi:cytochrome c biogenesis protein CcmG, thiol:disulfide interchange protein DsbE